MSTPRKQSNQLLVNRDLARTINCKTFYEITKHNLKTSDVNVSVQGVMYRTEQDFIPIGSRDLVPTRDVTLESILPGRYDHYLVIVDYTAKLLSPTDLMTRGEFLMEQLTLWEGLRTRVAHNKAICEEIDLVMQYTRNMYSADDLMNLSYLEKN